jgi:hypothetical protein
VYNITYAPRLVGLVLDLFMSCGLKHGQVFKMSGDGNN